MTFEKTERKKKRHLKTTVCSFSMSLKTTNHPIEISTGISALIKYQFIIISIGIHYRLSSRFDSVQSMAAMGQYNVPCRAIQWESSFVWAHFRTFRIVQRLALLLKTWFSIVSSLRFWMAWWGNGQSECSRQSRQQPTDPTESHNN